MRLYEYRQSATSPLKYHLEFNPEEFKIAKELVMDIMERVEKEFPKTFVTIFDKILI